MTTKRKRSRKGHGKGIPKARTVFGRVRFYNPDGTFVIELRLDGVHVRKLHFPGELRKRVTFGQLVDFSNPQLTLISAHGADDSKRGAVDNQERKEANGDKKEETKDTQTAQAAGLAGT